MINSGIGNNDITLSVGFDYSKAIGQDAPRAAAELQKVFNNFGGKNRALIEPLGRISSSTSEFAKSLEAANARVIAFGASVGIIYNIQKAFTELVKSTIQVEKKLTDINVVLSTSSSQLRKFGDELFSIANDTGKSFEEVSNAAIEFSRQGLGVEETLKRTKDALILTRIAGIDTKDAVDALTAGVNSFSKSLIDSTQIVNKFAAVDAAFAVSSQDLAEALRRVGSSAQDAGVDLDELAGLVTSVQQTTARGGAVIGNALKTIFSRLSRGETIRELKDLGVQIDESQTGIEKLKALSAALQNVSGTQGAAIKEAAGGVYQINVVSAALGDLSKQYGIYEQALMKSRGATDEAISRNKELGTTLASLATTTENNLVKAFSKIGNLSIDTPFRSILQGINTTLLEPMGKLGDEGGSEFVTNFFKGIGKFIEGPGLTYITLVGANLTKALVGFAGDAFKQLQRYNKDNAQLLATQKGISLELERDQNLVLGIASGNIKVADAQSLIIQRLQQDLALREKIAAISKGIGQGVIKSGIAYSAETGIPQRIRKTFAGGLVPSPKEVFAESLGAMDGGYKPGKVKVTNIPGLGRAVYNDNETIKNFPGMQQPAIMPPQNSSAGQKYQRNFYGKHGFNPYMAGGMIPNFAFKSRAGSFGDVEFENKYGGGIMDIMGKTAEIGVFDTLKKGQGHSRGLYQDLFADLRNKGIKTVKGFLIPQTDNKPRENTDLSKLKALLPQIIRGRYGKSSVLSVGNKTFNIPGGKDFDNYLNANQKSIWGAVSRGEDVDYVTYLNGGNVPNFLPTGILKAYREVLGKIKNKQVNFFNPNEGAKVWAPLKTAGGFYNPKDQSINISKNLKKNRLESSYQLGFITAHEGVHNIVDLLSKPEYYSKLKDESLKKGFIKSELDYEGSGIFNRIKRGKLDETYTYKRLKANSELYPDAPRSFLEESLADNSLAIIKDRRILGFSDKTAYNFRKSFNRLDKAGRGLSNYKEKEIIPHNVKGWQTAFSGIVPNFSGLAGAIKRESQSVPASTIKVGMDSRLKSAQNPSGLGVYNTIHEPNGLSQGITRAYSEGLNPKTYNVPNFADFKLESKNYGSSYLDKVLRPQLNELLGSIQKNKVSFDKLKPQIDSLIKESQLTAKSASSVRGIFRNAELNRPGTLETAVQIGAQAAEIAKNREIIQKGIKGFSQFARFTEIGGGPQAKGLLGNAPLNFIENTKLLEAGQQPKALLEEKPYQPNFQFYKPSRGAGEKFLPYNAPKALLGSGRIFYQGDRDRTDESKRLQDRLQQMDEESRSEQRRALIAKKIEELKRKRVQDEIESAKQEELKQKEISSKITSLRQKADSFNFFGSGRAIKEATALQKSGAITKEEVEALKGLRNNRIQTAAGLGSFLVPTVLTPALQGISDNKKYQATVETASSVASLGLTGLSVGATMGGNAGPIGAGIGATVGFLTSLPALLKAINDPLPKLLEDLQKLQESFSKSSANLQQYSALTDKLSEVYSGAIKNVTVKQVNELETERAKTFSLLDPKVKTLLDRAGADPMRRNEIMGAVTSAQQNRLTFGESLSKIKEIKLLDEVNRESSMKAGFGGLGAYAAISTTPNYKNIEQNKKTLQDATKSLLSGLTGLKNLETGKDVFGLTKENKGLQNLFGTVQSFEGLKIVLESINKDTPLDNFTEQFANFEAVVKKQPRLLKELLSSINDSLGEEGIKKAIANNKLFEVTEKEKNKIIDDSINKLLQFNSSLLKFSSDLQVINQKGLLDLDFKINSEKLKMNVQNTLESLNAGDYQKASIKFRENAQENIQKQDLGLFNSKIQTNQEYIEKLSEFQSNFLKSGLKDVTEINKGSPSQLREAIDSYQTRIFSFFEKAGLSNIDVKNLDKKKIDELLKNLTDKATNFAGSPSSSGPEATGLKESELNELLKTLPELRINLEKAQRDQQARDEIIRYQFEKAGLLNTEEKRAQFGIIGGANFDALTKLQNSNRFDIGQTRISANFERSQQLQKLRDDFALSNLGGAGRLNKQFDINQRNIISQSNFESSNLLPKLLQREGANNLQFNEVGTKISTKEQLDNEIKIREEKSKGKEISVNERDILTALKRVQEDFISGQEKIVISKENSLELSKETLKIEKELLKYRFQEERIADNLKNIEGRIKEGRGISGGDIKSVIKEQFDYTPRDFQRDAILGVNEVSATIKTSFSGAISSIIKDGKSFGDAFREMLIGVLNKIVDKTSDITTNLLFNGISSAASSFAQGKNAGGLIKGYSTGGQVTGGSGVRDDVPAMLTDGEYVIKKSAVEAIGKANLDKINYGNDSVAFNLKNDYAYNDPKFPTSGKLDVSSALSNFGLMDTTISRTNELRLEKEQNLISYLEQKRSYDKNVGDAMRAFRQQKRNRLYGAYLSAAAGVAGAGLSSAFGPTAGSGASKGVDFNGFQYTGARMAATGGLIQKFANGGHVFGGNSITDTIPAMLTGGEYVIKKDKVSKFGKNFFDNLNNSSVRKYADGGLVSPAFAPVNTNKGINTDLTLQFNSLTNAINNLSNSIKPNTNKDNYGINNYITVSVSVDSQNGVTTESSVNSQSKGNTRNENDQNQVEKLRKGLENDMGAFINKQMKQGGTIYTFVNSRIGR